MKRLVKDLLENRHALRIQLKVNAKSTVATTKLGTLWWILDPLFLMLIYYFVFNVIFTKADQIIIYLFSAVW
jgi:ABC-type polysaccharide/polyol phosphate export permease